MNHQEKEELEARRKDAAIKSMYYNRYFMIRYITVFFLGANLFWMILLYTAHQLLVALVPSIVLIFGTMAMWEQKKMYTREQAKPAHSRRYFCLQMSVNGLLIVLTLLGFHPYFLPMLKENAQARLVIVTLFAIGILIATLMLARLNQIEHNRDRQYQRVKQMLVAMKQ